MCTEFGYLIPPPDRVYMSNADFVTGHLTFNWSSVSPDCPRSSIHYNILASNCGSCPTTTNHTTVTCTDVPIINGSMCTFAVQTVVCGNITGNRSVPIRVNTDTVYHTQTSCDSSNAIHNSVYIISISCIATAMIISVVVFITVVVIILMRTKGKIKAAFETQPEKRIERASYTESMYEDVTGPSCSDGAINIQQNVAYGHKQTPAH